MRKKATLMLSIVLAVLTVTADQLSKQWALSNLKLGERQDVWGNFVGFELHFNPGAAFSFLTGATWLFTIIALVVSIALPLYMRRVSSSVWLLTLAVVWGGAVGNLIDRLCRAPGFGKGHVVDFIAYGDWFIGNVADIALTGGIILLAFLLFFGVEPYGDSGEKSPMKDELCSLEETEEVTQDSLHG